MTKELLLIYIRACEWKIATTYVKVLPDNFLKTEDYTTNIFNEA